MGILSTGESLFSLILTRAEWPHISPYGQSDAIPVNKTYASGLNDSCNEQSIDNDALCSIMLHYDVNYLLLPK